MPASSGLDAAGPQFNDSESNEIRLHHTDADFVDAIHTDAGQVKKINQNFCINYIIYHNSFIIFYIEKVCPARSSGSGMTIPAGHADFYPNGGRNVSHLELKR